MPSNHPPYRFRARLRTEAAREGTSSAQAHDHALDRSPGSRVTSTALLSIAERCGVPVTYLPLLAALEAGPRPHVDLVIANEVDTRPALIAVGATGVTVVDPSNGDDGPYVIHVAYSAVHGARVVKEGIGRSALRWFVVDADEPLSIPLSRRAAEAASQLAFVVSQRLGRGAVEPLPRHPRDDGLTADARKLRELHASGVLSDHEYRAARARLTSGAETIRRG